MKLKSIEYTEYENGPREWKIDGLELGDINLIVGVNASGKTRALRMIESLGRLLSMDINIRDIITSSLKYKAEFEELKETIVYELVITRNAVSKEKLTINSKEFLDRGPGGGGRIREQGQDQLKHFKVPDIGIAAYKKRDELQHPFLERLYDWGANLRFYAFGSDMGKGFYGDMGSPWIERARSIDERIEVLQKFHDIVETIEVGKQEFGDRFLRTLVKDMKEIGYSIKDVTVNPGKNSHPLQRNKYLSIEEKDLASEVEQHNISQGMWRAFSLLAHMNLFDLMKKESFVLIDDIGEGLDYGRAVSLIQLLIKKAKKSKVQLLMSSNDRFTMNCVPLKYWSIIERRGSECRVLNYGNSKVIFDDFSFTGLSNFDFFATRYFLRKPA